MGPILEMKGVIKRYGKRLALDGFDLVVPQGSVFGLVGSNGAGKTTTMMIIAGLTKRNAGTVRLFGGGDYDSVEHAGRISMMPQDSDLPSDACVRELLMYYAELQGISRKDAGREVMDVIEWVHLSDRINSCVRTLSHGMKRRVVIAQALLGNPELIMLDEPLSGLDPREVINVRNMLINRRGRQTIIISSHNLHEVELVCDHVAFIENGRTIRQDTMKSMTGHTSLLLYHLADWCGNEDELRKIVKCLDIDLQECSVSDGAKYLLSCKYDERLQTASDVNAGILGYLLEKGMGILSVHRGEGLEKVFIDNSPVVGGKISKDSVKSFQK